ncbi:universal stress protein [Natronobacterium texcoconense]|uniref:Nucleotide-binding universal stress protein, UspA family n=1 Tax=Natronobacterium texcoconense TaxID=1095778 RepID=A0A1H1BXR4_NATTX|nr:universal stress protein [Natronobacterium texcoconense]SDQ56722.1 Nucleotide-binding universal stress protein, UspA family [Natronobacterium texcoconense]
MHVLVPIDDSDPARAALEWAVATYPDADVTALHVVEPSLAAYSETDANPYDFKLAADADGEIADTLFETATDRAAEHGVSLTTELLVGSPARAIVQFATDEEVDRIVVGSHGRTGISRVLLGSVAEQVVRRAPMSVTVVR